MPLNPYRRNPAGNFTNEMANTFFGMHAGQAAARDRLLPGVP